MCHCDINSEFDMYFGNFDNFKNFKYKKIIYVYNKKLYAAYIIIDICLIQEVKFIFNCKENEELLSLSF